MNNMNNEAQQLNTNYYNWQRETLFPVDSLPTEFNNWRIIALMCISPAVFKMPVDDFAALCTKPFKELTVWDMSVLLKCMQERSAKDMEFSTLRKYAEFAKAIEDGVRIFQDMCKPQYDQLQKDLQELKRANDAINKAKEQEAVDALAKGMGKAIPLPVNGQA